MTAITSMCVVKGTHNRQATLNWGLAAVRAARYQKQAGELPPPQSQIAPGMIIPIQPLNGPNGRL